MPGFKMNKRLFLVFCIFVVFCCIGWLRLMLIMIYYDLQPKSLPQLLPFSNEVGNNHDWYHEHCFPGIEHELDVSTLDDFIARWKVTYSPKICRNMYNTFSSIYSINRRSGQIIIPETFQTKFLKWLGNDEDLLKEAKLQFITSIYNQYTHEHTVLNPLRSKRPGINTPVEDTEAYIEELTKLSMQNCDFCDYKYKTAEDTFGRIESTHSATAANAFKMDGFHSLVILHEHNLRTFTEEQFLDVMQVSMKWYMKVYDTDKQYRYPHLTWDNLPKASASQVHPHAHITLGPVRHYGHIEHIRQAAIRYGLDNNGRNYFTDLIKIHSILGLAVHYGNATTLAYLTPLKDNDVMIISKTPCLDFFRLIYFTLRAFTDAKHYAWSMAVLFPKLEPWSTPDYDDIPAIARIVTRGPPSNTRSDVGAMEFFTINNVNIDPFTVVKHVQHSVESLSHPDNVLVEAQKQEIQQQILQLQQKKMELEQKMVAPHNEDELKPPQPHLEPAVAGKDPSDENVRENNESEEKRDKHANRILVEEIDKF